MRWIGNFKKSVVLFYLLGVSVLYGQEKITVHLEFKNDTVPINFGRTLGRPVDSSLFFKCTGFAFVNYRIRQIPIELNATVHGSDTTLMHKAFYYFIGLDSSNNIHVIPDLNWNQDFTDDKHFVFPAVRGQLSNNVFLQTIPAFQTQVETPFGKMPFDFKIIPRWLFPSLTLSSPDIFFDSVAVALEQTNYRAGVFHFKGKQYYVYVDNHFLAATYNSTDVRILLADTLILQKVTKFRDYAHLKDTIENKDALFILGEASASGDSLYVEAMELPKDYYMGNVAILDKKITLPSMKHFDIHTVLGKYIFLDFWGTWCVPCMELTDSIKAVYNEIILPNKDKISMISIAADNSIEKVNAYLAKDKIQWANIFQSLKDTSAPIIKHFRVGTYPYFVLISPEGKVIQYSEGRMGFFTARETLEKMFGKKTN
jgi:thiol-disulfide isomerase/thioredoxin